MSSRAPGSSGAIVIRRRPSRSGSRSRRSTSAGAWRNAGSWAPRRASARNGPSRLNPSGSAPSAGASGSHARTVSAKVARAGSGAVTAVGRNPVTPRRSRWRAIPSSASAPPIASWPPPPCTWTSTNPGAIYGSSSVAGAPAVRPAPPSTGSTSSTSAIQPSSIAIRPGSIRSSRTRRPRTLATSRLMAPARRRLDRAPRPRRRSRGRSGRRRSAIRSPRSGGRGRR